MSRRRLVALLLSAGLAAACGGGEPDEPAAELPAGEAESGPTAATDGSAGDDRPDDDPDRAAEAGGDESGQTAEAGGDESGQTAEAGGDESGQTAEAGVGDGAAEASGRPGTVEITATVVSAVDAEPLAGAVAIGPDQRIVADDAGRFTIEVEPGTTIRVQHPTWLPVEVEASDDDAGPGAAIDIALEPVVARGVRVSRYVAADNSAFDDLLGLVRGTTVNALVFDTKDETGSVLYDSDVPTAIELDAVDPIYSPERLLARAREEGLYPITRVVTFEDDIWSAGDPEAKLAGDWVDATDRANWEYPLGLAEEACRLGFAEIQFDYIRYPAGRTAEVAADLVPPTSEERSAVIAAFLTEAGDRLRPLGCGVSAAIFGIVMSSETDEGIGQTVEAIGPTVDALSPMLYPSHYGPGWLGFADPNDHPGPVIADALDDGQPRLDGDVQLRPWIQAFFYTGAQIAAQIDEAEARGAGWLLWNASGNYRADWLPTGATSG